MLKSAQKKFRIKLILHLSPASEESIQLISEASFCSSMAVLSAAFQSSQNSKYWDL